MDEELKAIGRLRRNQGRNADTMLVCNALEKLWHQYKLIAKATKIEVVDCEHCKSRLAQTKARVARHRLNQKRLRQLP